MKGQQNHKESETIKAEKGEKDKTYFKFVENNPTSISFKIYSLKKK